jgi:prophage DNA circulation protein
MTWQEDQQFLQGGVYKRASFKSVPFWVSGYKKAHGRRQSVQKFPGDRFTIIQDLGEDSAEFSVQAFIMGNFYHKQRDDLEAKLLEGGEGDLYLPWRGTIKVTIVGKPVTSESRTERGFCTISFRCIVTAPKPDLFTPDSAQEVRDISEEARNQTQAVFVDGYSAAGEPQARKLKITEAVDSISTKLVDAQDHIGAQINLISTGANQVSRLFSQINVLINQPLEFSDAVIDAVVTTYSSIRSTTELLKVVVTTWGRGGPLRILADQTFPFLLGFSAPTVPILNQTGQTEQDNLDQVYRHARLQMFYEVASAMTTLEFSSRQHATQFRTEYIEVADFLSLDMDGDEFEVFADLNTAVHKHLEKVSATLPELGTFTPADTLPSVVVAHLAYGDARLEPEIVARNDIPFPGFVPQGEPLEVVLLDGS